MRKFVTALTLPQQDEPAILRTLVAAFPELTWRDGEGNFGKIFLAGESRETKPQVSISLLCKEPPGPFVLTIALRNDTTDADALRARVAEALHATASRDPV
jgi:hypothetical protein